jgi:organic radical activating enzyme
MLSRIKTYAHRADTNKLVFLGGDPLYKNNLELTTYLVNNLKDEFNICIFTGYDIEYVKKLNIDGVKYWKCGTYDQTKSRQSKKTDKEYVLASPNQDFYDGNYNKLSENGILTF